MTFVSRRRRDEVEFDAAPPALIALETTHMPIDNATAP